MKVKETNDGISFLAECEECKQGFEVNNSNLKYNVEYYAKDKIVYLTSYECPNCGNVHFVQIDDDETLELFKKVRSQFVKLSVMREKGKGIPKSLNSKYKRDSAKLSKMRHELMVKYQGKEMHKVENGSMLENFIIVKFSV